MSSPNIISNAAQVKGEYDFIIVGGGTAGCTVAGRLAEISPNISVLVIEAGKSSFGVKEISTPALAATLVESEHDWAYQATLIDLPDFKRVEDAVTRGKVLGGSSSLNYYSWHRGSAALYDEWQAYGGPTWNWTACKQYFSKPTTIVQKTNVSLLPINTSDIGTSGPVKLKAVDPVPLGDALVKAWKSRGLPTTSDIFNGHPNGLTHLLATVVDGERNSSVRFIETRHNITVLTQSKVARVIIEKGAGAQDGNIAKGVEIVGGTVVHAKHEVIVSSGVFESPHVLMLSGIGVPQELEAHGIACKVDSPQVGKNLMERVIFPQVFRLKEGSSLDTQLRPGPQFDAAVREYEQQRTGTLASPLLEFSAWTRIDERLSKSPEYVNLKQKLGKDPLGSATQPHFEFDFVPAFFHPFQPHVPIPTSGDYMTIVTGILRPLSRGNVGLRSSQPTEQPEINLNFFAEEVDLVAVREAGRFVREIVEHGEGMRDYVIEPYPADLRDLDGDNEAAKKLIFKRCSTGYHPCGTCRIGTESGTHQGVVDERLRVRGVANLRVIDASVIPIIPDCRIQAPVYMVAEKGAAIVREDYERKIQPGGN
ncbi:GMC oxidoreductase [Ramaria rubella]|nr:GMC oxidoreductase [Ramaria rubella]